MYLRRTTVYKSCVIHRTKLQFFCQLYSTMNKLSPFFSKTLIEAGCDEAGRGCLAGPVVAAAVILPKDFSHPLLNDSKQLSEKKRDELRITIETEAISYGVCFVHEEEIDEIGLNEIARISIRTASPLFYDSYSKNRQTGSVIFIDPNTYETVGAGMII